MNESFCHMCGTPLPSIATRCLRCGARFTTGTASLWAELVTLYSYFCLRVWWHMNNLSAHLDNGRYFLVGAHLLLLVIWSRYLAQYPTLMICAAAVLSMLTGLALHHWLHSYFSPGNLLHKYPDGHISLCTKASFFFKLSAVKQWFASFWKRLYVRKQSTPRAGTVEYLEMLRLQGSRPLNEPDYIDPHPRRHLDWRTVVMARIDYYGYKVFRHPGDVRDDLLPELNFRRVACVSCCCAAAVLFLATSLTLAYAASGLLMTWFRR